MAIQGCLLVPMEVVLANQDPLTVTIAFWDDADPANQTPDGKVNKVAYSEPITLSPGADMNASLAAVIAKGQKRGTLLLKSLSHSGQINSQFPPLTRAASFPIPPPS